MTEVDYLGLVCNEPVEDNVKVIEKKDRKNAKEKNNINAQKRKPGTRQHTTWEGVAGKPLNQAERQVKRQGKYGSDINKGKRNGKTCKREGKDKRQEQRLFESWISDARLEDLLST